MDIENMPNDIDEELNSDINVLDLEVQLYYMIIRIIDLNESILEQNHNK